MKKILIIDDDEDFLEWIHAGLVQEEYQIITSMTGKAGLEIALKEIPDVAIIDLHLPDLDGLEICRSIRKSQTGNRIAVILITGIYKEVEVKEKGYELGADDFLVKPFSYEQLKIRLAKLIKKYDDKRIMIK